MDTSKDYRNMAEKATEIQKMWKHNIGDFYFVILDKIPKAEIVTVRIIYSKQPIRNGIWLPRQDQLQDIIREIYYKQVWTSTDSLIAQEFSEHLTSIKLRDVDASMEMLWLDWTMFLLFGKYWDGNCWTKK